MGSTGRPQSPARAPTDLPPGPPPPPDEALVRPRPGRRWGPLVGVVALIGLVTLGARGVDALSQSAGPTVGFDGILMLHPPPGWTEQGREEEATTHRLLLTRGSTGLYVAAVEENRRTLTPGAVAFRYGRSLSEALPHFARGVSTGLVLTSGLPAVRFLYAGMTGDGVAVQGIVTAIVSEKGTAIVFEGRAHLGVLAPLVDDIDAMIEGAEVT